MNPQPTRRLIAEPDERSFAEAVSNAQLWRTDTDASHRIEWCHTTVIKTKHTLIKVWPIEAPEDALPEIMLVAGHLTPNLVRKSITVVQTMQAKRDAGEEFAPPTLTNPDHDPNKPPTIKEYMKFMKPTNQTTAPAPDQKNA